MDKPKPKTTEFFKKIGAKGGKNSTSRPFRDKNLARLAGSIGGKKSKRTKKVKDAMEYEL